jgi:aspartyl-tRNA synthetase
VVRPQILIKSSHIYFYVMEAPKEIKVIDYTKDTFGDYPFIRSAFRSERKWIPLAQIDESKEGQEVLVRARIHNVRSKGNNCFIELREDFYTLQACAFTSEATPKEMITYMAGVPNESIVDIVGKISNPGKPIKSCTQQVELQITKFFVVNRAANRLPLQIADASRKVLHNEFDPNEEDEEKKEEPKVQQPEAKVEEAPKEEEKAEGKEEEIKEGDPKAEEKKKAKEAKKAEKEKKKKEKEEKEKEKNKETEAPIVLMKTRLDNRIIDLRTTGKQAIFRISSAVCHLFREFLIDRDFVEIHTPKLIAGSSEGGSNVFTFSYFNRKACLAQSPQLYKQMCVMGDFQRVFEIGPVFRAENSFTHRHMCEFVGLDLEMSIK